MKVSKCAGSLYRRLTIACLLAAGLLVTGCSDDKAGNLERIEAVDPSLADSKVAGAEKEQDGGAENAAIPGAQSQDSPERIFSVSAEGITLVGTDLSRNMVINQLVEIDEAWLLGDPLSDRRMNLDMRSQSMGAVLGELLEDVDYQARFERHVGSRSSLHTLWIGEPESGIGGPVANGSEEIAAGLASPVEPADGSFDAGEEYVQVLSNRFSSGDRDEQVSVIIETELTEGGVAFLNHILHSEQDPEILIEVIRRLEAEEAFGAKWALLQSLSHPNPVIQLEILESIEVWRDPTIKKYVEPLTNHYDSSVREKALELVDSLNTYAEIGIAADPYGIDQASQPVSPEQRAQRILKVEQRQKQVQERSRNRQRPGAE